MPRGSMGLLAAALCLAAAPAFAEAGRTLRSVSPPDGNQLVYEYEGAQEGAGRLTIDTSTILRDVDRSKNRKPKKKAVEPRAAAAALPTVEQTSLRADVAAPQPAALTTPAPLAADRKVRVIQLYNVPQN